MAVNLGKEFMRTPGSGAQRNERTQPISQAKHIQRIQPRLLPGIQGGGGLSGGLEQASSGGAEESIRTGQQIQSGANTAIADEQAYIAALKAAEQRELAKTETIILENTVNAFDVSIKAQDTNKINASDVNRMSKADALFNKPFEESMKIAEGRSSHFNERLRLKLDAKRDSQLGALNAHWITQQESQFVGLWQGQVGMLSARADGTTLIQDLIETEKISFNYRGGMGADKWETTRLAEMKKVTASHLKALRRRFPLEEAREEYDRLLGDPTVQGILQDDLQEEIDRMVAVEKAAKDRENNDPIVQAQKEVAAVTKIWQKDHPGEDLPFLQVAAILSKRFAPTPSQNEKSAQDVKIEHFNFLKKELNALRVANGQAMMTPQQESELFLGDTVQKSGQEKSEDIAEESRLKQGRTEVNIEEINKRRIQNGLDPLTADQEQEYDLTGKFSKSIGETFQDARETKEEKDDNLDKFITKINQRRVAAGKLPLDDLQEAQYREKGTIPLSIEEADAEKRKVTELESKRIDDSRAEQGLPPLSPAEKAKNQTGFETPAEKGAAAGESDVNEIAALLGKQVKDLTPEDRKLKLPKRGTTIITPFETAFSKQSGTSLAKRFDSQVELAKVGQEGNLQLESITAALKTNSYDPGILPDTRIFLSTAATFVQDKTGIDMSAVTRFLGSAAAGNQLDAAGKRLLLQLAKGIGRITNLSLRFAEDAVPGIFRTREGLEMISALMKRENDINIGLGKIADIALGMEPAQARVFYRDSEVAYRKNNPLFNRELQDRMLSMANKNRPKGAKKFTRVGMFSKAPKKSGMTLQGTKDGFHWYKNDKTGENFKMSIHGEDSANDPVGKYTSPVNKTNEQAAAPKGGESTVAATNAVSMDQVQSVVSDLLQNVDPDALQGVMQGIQDLFKGGNK